MPEEVISPDPGTTDPGPEQAVEMHEWLADLPEDLQGNASLAKFKTKEEAARSYVQLQALVGRKRALPAEDAPAEEWDQVYADLGRPENQEGYQFALPENYPQEFMDEDLVQGFRGLALKAGLNQKQFDMISHGYLELSKGKIAGVQGAIVAAKKEAEAELMKDWGDDYEPNISLCNRVIRECGDERVKSSLAQKDPVWNHPALARFLLRIAKERTESVFTKGDGGGAVASVEARLLEIARDPDLLDANTNPEKHRQLVQERDKLMAVKHPEEQK